jgi:heavy metal sensor kinase
MPKLLPIVPSLRARLTFWYSLVLLCVLILFGLAAHAYWSRHLQDSLDRSLGLEAGWVAEFLAPRAGGVAPSRRYPPYVGAEAFDSSLASDTLRASPSSADDEIWEEIYQHALLSPKKTLIEVVDHKGGLVFRSFTGAGDTLFASLPKSDSLQFHTIAAPNGEDYRVATMSSERFHIACAYPLADLNYVVKSLFSILLVLVPVALFLSIAGGWFLAKKSLRPVDDVTNAARSITAQNLDREIPRPEVDDEIGRLIDTLNEMIRRLRGSFERIRQFTLDASHELRTPLTIVRGEVEVSLQSARTPDEYRRTLASTLDEIIRVSAIIDNLLDVAQADRAHPETLRFEPVLLSELVEELYEDGLVMAQQKRLEVELLRNDAVSVEGDPLRLRQMLLNLLDNAIKYTPAPGKVTISLEHRNGDAYVVFADTGIGIPKDEHAKIFERFYRVDKARSREFGGSGLGLSIVKWVSELHGGHVAVESEPGLGSTFTVRLPAVD